MFEALKKKPDDESEDSPLARVWRRTSHPEDGGPIISANLDRMNEKEQAAFQQAVAAKSDVEFFTGHVEHGYSLAYARQSASCPRCQGATRQYYANFIYATQIAPRVMMAPAGYFCTNCPTVIIDEELLRGGVSRGFKYQDVVGIELERNAKPDFFKTWNGEKPVFVFDENETLLGFVKPHELSYDEPAASGPALSEKNWAKQRKRRKMAKESRKRNRRR